MLQTIWYLHLDLSDLPGAAGVWSLYLAASGTPKSDPSALLYFHLSAWIPLSLLNLQAILSTIQGMTAIIGASLLGRSLAGREAGFYCGTLMAVWSPMQIFGLLCGNDTLCVSLSFLGIGLFFYGLHGKTSLVRLPLAMIGCSMLVYAASIKEFALPLMPIVVLFPMVIKRYDWRWFVCGPLLLYSAYWSYAWFPAQNERISLLQSRSPIWFWEGWEYIRDMTLYRMGETKLEQLIPLTLLLSLFPKQRLRKILIAFTAILILTTTAFFLEHRVRPRFIAPAALLLFASLAYNLRNLPIQNLLFPLLVLGFCVDTWSYIQAWSDTRTQLMGTERSKLPEAPSYWKEQYMPVPDRVLRDVSLYGAAELVKKTKQGIPLATLPLRDARERALMAYATLHGTEHVVLNPKKCCKEDAKNCAKRLVTELQRAGITLALPKKIPRVNRIDGNQTSWLDLLTEYSLPSTKEESQYWWFWPHEDFGGHTPCKASRRPN
ncbi:MAG: hypothetical protein VX278_09395 [Myxococcota bacterium]|nr:hypothetical protein [Myxococcota bacterium]